MSLPTVFSTCRPRPDVLGGTVRDDEFMADLSRVVKLTAPADYLDPAAFFAKSYPTRGMKELRKLAFSETVPAPKMPEQIPLDLPDAPEDNEEV